MFVSAAKYDFTDSAYGLHDKIAALSDNEKLQCQQLMTGLCPMIKAHTKIMLPKAIMHLQTIASLISMTTLKDKAHSTHHGQTFMHIQAGVIVISMVAKLELVQRSHT